MVTTAVIRLSLDNADTVHNIPANRSPMAARRHVLLGQPRLTDLSGQGFSSILPLRSMHFSRRVHVLIISSPHEKCKRAISLDLLKYTLSTFPESTSIFIFSDLSTLSRHRRARIEIEIAIFDLLISFHSQTKHGNALVTSDPTPLHFRPDARVYVLKTTTLKNNECPPAPPLSIYNPPSLLSALLPRIRHCFLFCCRRRLGGASPPALSTLLCVLLHCTERVFHCDVTHRPLPARENDLCTNTFFRGGEREQLSLWRRGRHTLTTSTVSHNAGHWITIWHN